MSDADSIIFKRKPKPSQRPREKSADDTDATSEALEVESPSAVAARLKNKVKRVAPKSKLSFGGDDEGEVFQIKKSSLSRKLALGTHPALTAAPGSTSPQRVNGGPVYDQAHLSELKASTMTSRLRPNLSDAYDGDVSLNIEDVSIQGIDFMDNLEKETNIPSESSINTTKQKRKKLRETGGVAASDYIPLTVTKRDDIPQGPHPESRLVREEDELGDGDDEFSEYTSARERIALGKKGRKLEAVRRREAMMEMMIDAEDEDEDSKEWAEEQERRAGHKVEIVTSTLVKEVYKPAPIPAMTPVPTLGPALARLSQAVSSLTISHKSNSHSATMVAEEHAKSDERENVLRGMVAKAEEKRSWFAAFNEWVQNVATFLDEKFPLLEKLEDEHASLLKERYGMISKRRRADDEDDLSILLGSPPLPTPLQEEVDDLGRAVPTANSATGRRERRAARVTRRTYRRARLQTSTAEEGYSTDSSLSPEDAADYTTAMQKLQRDGEAILSDVRAEEFSDPRIGLTKWFTEWRSKFNDSYTSAWGGPGLVLAWEFWARLEILGWNPFDDYRSLDGFIWFSSLHEYSQPHADEDDEMEPGQEADLTSEMNSMAVIPRLCKIIEGGALDPYSYPAIRRMVDLAEQMDASVGNLHVRYQALLKSVFVVLQLAVMQSIELVQPYLTLNNPKFDPEAIPARCRFLARRIKFLQNLVQWRKYTGERFGIGKLAMDLLTECMLPVAETGWEVGGEESMRKVVAFLPPDLLPNDVKARIGQV